MPLKYFTKLEEIDEANRGNAVELKDGRFAIEEAGKTETDVNALNTTLEKVRGELKEAEKARKELDKKVKDFEQERDALSKGVTEQQLAEIRKAEADKWKPTEEENARLKSENEKLKLDDRLQRLYLDNNGMADRVEDAMLALKPRARLGDAGGIVFKTKDGKDSADDAKVFFAAFATEKPWLFQGNGSNGGGGGRSDGDNPGSAEATKQRTNELRSIVSGAL